MSDDRRFLVVRRERGRLVFQIWHQPMPPTWPKHEREFTVAVRELAPDDARSLDELAAAWSVVPAGPAEARTSDAAGEG
jgi:hypothetical protein